MTKITAVRNHVNAASSLASYLKTTGMSNRLASTVKTHCQTRWNTVYLMLESILDNYATICELINEKQQFHSSTTSQSQSTRTKAPIDYLMDINTNAISKIAKYLKPFKDITMNIEGT